jgi:hypothetical protein
MISVNVSKFFILVRGFFASNHKFALYPIFIMPVLSKPKTRALTLVAEFKASKFESPAVTKSSNSVINDFPGIIAKLPESVAAIKVQSFYAVFLWLLKKSQHEDVRMLMDPYYSDIQLLRFKKCD